MKQRKPGLNRSSFPIDHFSSGFFRSDSSKSGSAQTSTSFKIPHGDLPIGHKEIAVIIVETPWDFTEVENRTRFYVRVRDQDEK